MKIKRREPFQYTIKEAAALMRRRELMPVELVSSILDRIDEVEGKVRAFVHVSKEKAMEEAKRTKW